VSCSFKRLPKPVAVPPVPTPTMTWVSSPRVCSENLRCGRLVVRPPVIVIAVLVAEEIALGVSVITPVNLAQSFVVTLQRVGENELAPCASSRFLRSMEALFGMTISTG